MIEINFRLRFYFGQHCFAVITCCENCSINKDEGFSQGFNSFIHEVILSRGMKNLILLSWEMDILGKNAKCFLVVNALVKVFSGRNWSCCDRKSRAACAKSFAPWQQATVSKHHQLFTRFTSIIRSHSPRSLHRDHSIIACSRHVHIFLFFAHIPFVVNHTINATLPERLQQNVFYESSRNQWRISMLLVSTTFNVWKRCY